MSKGYGGNFIYARVIEAELDKRGLLADLHATAERLAKKPWADIQKNPSFYSKALYQAACEVAPDVFSTPEEVAQALKNAEKGELYNVQFLVETILEDLKAREKALKKPCRLVLVLDESGQWIEDDAGSAGPAPGPRRGGRPAGPGQDLDLRHDPRGHGIDLPERSRLEGRHEENRGPVPLQVQPDD